MGAQGTELQCWCSRGTHAPPQGSAGTGSKCEGQQGADLAQRHPEWKGAVLGWDWGEEWDGAELV